MRLSARTAVLGLLALGAAASVVALRGLGASGTPADDGRAPRTGLSSPELAEPGGSSSAIVSLPVAGGAARTALRPVPQLPPEPDVPRPDLARLRADGANEKAFYEAYCRLARESPGELTASARDRLLRPDLSDSEKIAMLRAVHVEGLPAFVDLFATALVELPDVAPRGLESIPSFAVRFLGELGPRDPRAREILERAIWPVAGAAAPAVRRRAAAYLGASISAVDIPRISALLAREPDAGVVEAALASIAANPRTAQRQLHLDFGLPVPKVVSDAEDEG